MRLSHRVLPLEYCGAVHKIQWNRDVFPVLNVLLQIYNIKFIFIGVLLVDEMKLSKTLYFNRKDLKVEGFVDLGKYTPEEQKKKKETMH